MPLVLYARGDIATFGEVASSLALTASAGAASAALWFYGQRYVGELALCNEATVDAATTGGNSAAETQRNGVVSASSGVHEGVVDKPALKSATAAQPRRAGVVGVSSGVYEGIVDEPAGVLGKDGIWVRISTLDFWGRRQDSFAPVQHVESMCRGLTDAQIAKLASATLLPLNVHGDKQYLLSLRHGELLNRAHLLALLKGKLHP